MIVLFAFESYNTTPNMTRGNNKFHIEGHVIEVPPGTYEVSNIARYLQGVLTSYNANYYVNIEAKNSTMHSSLKSTMKVDFMHDDSVGRLLGLKKKVLLEPGCTHISDDVVDLFQVSAIRIDFNITSGSYVNGYPSDTVYEFFPDVPAGYKLLELPFPVIYSPLTIYTIDNNTLRVVVVVDQIG